eukprot:1403325-Pleurochrysis_carterae.AAC.1
MGKTTRKALGYCVVSQDGGAVPNSSCCLVEPESALFSTRLAGLTAQQLPKHVYEVNLKALRASRHFAFQADNDGDKLIVCASTGMPSSCRMNCLTNGFCKHVWVAATTLKMDRCELVKTWATSGSYLQWNDPCLTAFLESL